MSCSRPTRKSQPRNTGRDFCMSDTIETVNAYLRDGIHSVGGWCIPQLWQSIWPIYQEIGEGPVAEIGVFEGKFLIGLSKTFGTGLGNRAVAIDVFDEQEFNLDKAGVGKLDVLKENLRAQGIDPDYVECIQADSLSLGFRDADRLISTIGKCKFFSVDGCHEVVHTVNDIEFAMAVTANDGIIAVDDYTNPNWPGVQEAVARMYLMRDFSFIPLVVTCNKLLLASYSYHARYLRIVHQYIKQHYADTRMKKVKRFGFDTLTIQPDLKNWTDLA
ncbi:hypothetical protein C2I36_16215 [Rhodobacteraceae bacterium WD3A24]|nr:hypothetical protein C2I36_16215 [Rhodobacteraceae bacterium WD3A24]